jgi:gamma-glutamyltranspeptidase/glutathione hydrolase
MSNSPFGTRGIAVAPHSLAAQSALDVLREGGNALEAMIAAAAAIAVVYPHMNSIGGDGFWVIHKPGHAPAAIDGSGRSAKLSSIDWYTKQGITGNIPFRGPLAALTVAGTVSGWGAAHKLSKGIGGRMSLKRLLSDSIYFANEGIPITASQARTTQAKLSELKNQPGFAKTFLRNRKVPLTGTRFKQSTLANTLSRIANEGTDSFYRGSIAQDIAADLQKLGSPLRLSDLHDHHAKLVDPLELKLGKTRLLNMTPPTQGVVSLMILGIMDALKGWQDNPEGPDFIHAQVEATKLAFKLRNQHVTDPNWMSLHASSLLNKNLLTELSAQIDLNHAAPWGQATDPGDTVWMGVIDNSGLCVSFIQSIYHEFGSGLVLPQTGINWQNRGCAFALDETHINALMPNKKTFHTLNPAIALLADGRNMVYGTMGGEGQPQTQATLFQRIQAFGDHPQQAINRPRWLLGRTWGQSSESLKLENRFSEATFNTLKARGHDVEWLDSWDEAVGHAGILIKQPNGLLVGGFDPRSDGGVSAY